MRPARRREDGKSVRIVLPAAPYAPAWSREALFEQMRHQLKERLGLSSAELESVLFAVKRVLNAATRATPTPARA